MTKRHDKAPGADYSVEHMQEPYIEGGRVVLAGQPSSGTTAMAAGAAGSFGTEVEVGR